MPGPAPRLRRMHYEPPPGTADGPPRPTRTTRATPCPTATGGDRVAVHAALGCVIRLALEVLDGRRPAIQLKGYFDAAPLRYWQVATEQRRASAPARVVRMVLCLPRPDAAEVSTVCEIDGRIRALAARFERTGPLATWHCTAVRLG